MPAAAPDPNKPAVTGQHAPIPIILGSLAAPAPETPPIWRPTSTGVLSVPTGTQK